MRSWGGQSEREPPLSRRALLQMEQAKRFPSHYGSGRLADN